DHARCVDISTQAAIREMVLPGLLAVVVPVAIGFYDKNMLGGLLVGVTVTGVLMASFQSNAGGAWDNAKKRIEGGVTFDGVDYGKGSEVHKAAVVGDTVGDPLKDTSGPSLNILVKLISVVALVIAPLIAGTDAEDINDPDMMEIEDAPLGQAAPAADAIALLPAPEAEVEAAP
ncbi:MAG: sodium/proton-translocating pyrophosphatase, partial [Bacteroidota bacterium]